MLNIKAFNDVARCHAEWRDSSIPYEDSYRDNIYKEHYLSLGLSFVNKLNSISSFEERARFLSPCGKVNQYFLSAFVFNIPYKWNIHTFLEDPVLRDNHAIRMLAFADELDRGPEHAWIWAYQGRDTYVGIAKEEMRDLRRNGYIFCDLDRLQEWGFLDVPFQS